MKISNWLLVAVFQLIPTMLLAQSCSRMVVEDINGNKYYYYKDSIKKVYFEGINPDKFFSNENEAVHRYMQEVYYSDFSHSEIENYAKESGYRMGQPTPFFFPISDSNILGGYNDKVDFKLYHCWTDSLLIHNQLPFSQAQEIIPCMEPGVPMVYELSKIEAPESIVYRDTVLNCDQLRMILAYGGGNIRDIGGWKTKDGKSIRYGKIIRGSRVSKMIELDSVVFKKILKIAVDIDLRSNEELNLEDNDPSNDKNYSPFGDDVEYYHCPLPLHGDILLPYNVYADVIKIIIRSVMENKSIYIHCSGGADRTGALMILLESILGVIDSDIAKEYELTSFDQNYYDKSNFRYCTRCKVVLDYFASLGSSGDTQKEKIESFLLEHGVSLEELSSFRQIMLK